MLDWLTHRASVSPQKIALIYGEQHFTYSQLNELAARMAGQLAAAGVEAGQHVAALMPNGAEFVGLIHALARLGAVLVPLNVRLTAEELRWQVNQANCRLVVCTGETETQAANLNLPTCNLQSATRPPANLPPLRQARPLDLSATQGIVFTSGTTGRPKGAMLTFGNHFYGATASAFRLGVEPADRWLACMPLYHVGGIAIILRCCLYGTTVVLHPGFDPQAVSQALSSQQVTLVSLVPTMLHRLLETHPKRLVDSRLRCILVGGGAAPAPLLEQCAALNLPVATTYGLTEAASQVATAPPAQAVSKPGSVGKPLMFTQVQIADDEGRELPPGEIGQIVVAGPTIMRGYYRQPQATQKALRNGWLHTGDLGYLDAEGDLWVVQRRVDLIVTGGENVYPAEVEQVLRRHPAVADACVVGVDNAEWGQQVAAAVVLNGAGAAAGEQALITFCREQLAGYKQPRRIRFVDTLPRTASGKVQRDKVRELLKKSTNYLPQNR